MAESSKTCPKCSGIMEFRLGEFSCFQCNHVEPKKTAAKDTRKQSGPGFKKTEQWSQQPADQHSSSGLSSSAPPPSTIFTPGQASQGAGFGQPGPKPLEVYEWILWGGCAFFIPLVGVVVASIWGNQNRPGSESCAGVAWAWWGVNVVILIILFLIGNQ